MTNEKDSKTVHGSASDVDDKSETKRMNSGAASEEFPGLLNFSTFIISLTTSTLVNLGEIADPVSNTRAVNRSLAKQTINIIEMLRDKTKGNLTGDEERLIDHVLYDLRMKYVSVVTKTQ
jgi:hypothetical protein